MPEEILFEHELRRSRTEAAEYLHTIADKLASGDPVTLSAGDESVTLDPPETVDFEVKAERETSSGADELSVEFELEWSADDQQGDLDVS